MQGGVSLNDRKLAANVRRKLLKEVEIILDGDDKALKKELLFKMCGTLLPRLQEHSGPDGESLVIKFDPTFNADTPRTTETSPIESSEV